jgi:hypothetical protein
MPIKLRLNVRRLNKAMSNSMSNSVMLLWQKRVLLQARRTSTLKFWLKRLKLIHM